MANYPSSLIVVDSQVHEHGRLVDELGRRGEVRLLRAEEDGIAVITDYLRRRPVDTLVIVAHGAPGQLHLGRNSLDLNRLDRYSEALGQWFNGASGAPQIHLYGCQVAAGDAGAEFLAKLHRLTGAGIAASPRLVGHADLGGDWRLDVVLGQATPQPVVSAELAASYRAVLGSNNFETATVWTPSTNTGTTVGATHQLGEPIHDPNLSGLNQAIQENLNNSIWWRWTAPTTGLITVDTFGSALSNTVLAVYTGGSVNSLNQVAFNDNSSTNLQSQVTFTAVAGTTYYFAVDGVGPDTGAVRLNLNAAPQINPNQVFSVLEGVANGITVGTLAANELGLTWSVVSGNPDNNNDGNRAFAVSSAGVITVNDRGDLDFEAFASTYNLVVRATDAGGLVDEKVVTINVSDANDAPAIVALTASQSSINEGGQITLSGSFRDPDIGDLQTVTINWGDGTLNDVIGSANLIGPDENGNLSIPSTRHIYQDNGAYTITMTVRDSAGAEVTRTTSVVVNNVPPTITQGSTLTITVNEDSPTTFTLNATDPGRLDTLTWSILNQSANGTATVSTSPTGRSQIISYIPNPNFAGANADEVADTFEVKVEDNNGGVDTILVNVIVVPQPDPPSGLNILGNVTAINEGETFTLTGTFSDPDAGDAFTVTINWGDNTPATVLLNSNVTDLGNGTYRFSASHTYRADSGAGAFSISAIVRDSAGFTVSDTLSLPVANVDPTIVQRPLLVLSTNEDTPLTFDLRATDPADTTFQWSILNPPPVSAGTLTFSTNPNGLASQTLVFTPAANFDQDTIFDVQVSDGNGGLSTVKVLVDVVPVNDAPTTLTLTPSVTTLNEGSVLTLNGSFIDVDTGDSHTVTINWGDGNSTVLTAGDLTLNPLTNTYTLASSPHTYVDQGTYTLSVTVEDADGATVNRTQTITVNNVAPTILTEAGTDPGAALTTINGTEDTPLTFRLRATDPGVNDILQWSISAAPGKGSVTILPAVAGQPQEFRYTPNANAFGADSFTVRLSDGNGGFDTVVVTVNLAAVNDLPTITANQFTITEGQALRLTTTNLNASDIETFAPNLRFEVTGLAPASGLIPAERFAVAGGTDNFFSLLDVIEGRVTFIDNGDETAPAFTITVLDSNIPPGTATALGNITFRSVNDAPVLGNNTFTVVEGSTTLITNASLSATDEELLLAGRNGELEYDVTRVAGGVIQVSGVTQTTFTQADIDGGRVTFVHGGEDIAPVLEYTVSDGLLSTPGTAVITFINVNDPPEILNNRLELTEGDIVPITLQNIRATDPDNDDNTLLFTITGLDSTTTSPTYAGQFERFSGGTWTATTTFTQQDIINGNVRFVHSNLEVTPAYTLTVSDNFAGTGGPLTASSEATVIFRAINDAPIFPTNVLSIDEGETLVLSSAEISATDEETPATGLTFTVSELVNGRFEFVATGAVTTTFTQDDINNGRVRFVHNGGEAAPSYTLTVSDGVNEVDSPAQITFTNVNDAPVLSRNQLAINEGQTRLITTTDINASDVETNANSLVFTVGQISGGTFTASPVFAGGRFELVASPGTAIGSFTRDDIINQRVRFVHDGTETRPSYAIQVQDLNVPAGVAFSQANVTLTTQNDLPIVRRNHLVIEQDGVFVFNTSINPGDPSTWDILTTDEETTDPSRIVYTVTAVSAGRFENVSDEGVAITTFTQAELDAGQIRFVHDGSEDAPIYRLSVSDGTGGVVTSNGNVTFENINDAPRFTANSFSLTEGGTLVLSTANINATDPESVDSDLLFTIGSVTGGRFERVSAPGTAITTFTLADIILGDIQFTQPAADEETIPTYTISVTDTGLVNPAPIPPSPPLTTGPVNGTIIFTPINDAPTINTHTLTITEGGVALFGNGSSSTGGVLSASDPETAAGLLVYTVDEASVVGGQFELVSDPSTDISNPDPSKAIFTFTQADITAQRVRFVQDGTSVTPNYTITVSDPQGLTAMGTPTVTFTDVNDPPEILRNSLTIAEGATVILSSTDLQYADEESSAAQVTYNVTNAAGVAATPVGGRFELVANPGVAITSFTQAQVNARAVQFVHDGTETRPSYYLTLTDSATVSGAPRTTAPRLAAITFARFNDAPTIDTNALTITEEGFVIVNFPDPITGNTLTLAASDEETPAANLTYVVDATTNGFFALDSAPTVAITSFTQAQVAGGEIRFVHDPASGENEPTYTLRVQDGEGKLSAPSNGTVTFIRINDDPVFSVNALTLNEGDVVTLTTAELLSEDEEDGAADLTYTVVGTVTGGKFVLASDATQTAIVSFTQAQVVAGAIQFVHDNTDTPPAYTLRVTDSEGGFAERTLGANLSFTPENDVPNFQINTLTLDEGATFVLDNANLFTTDEESGPANLTYRVQSVANGRFALASAPTAAITSFTQAQVTAREIVFVHDGSETPPTYTLDVIDGGGETATIPATIVLNPVNDAPSFLFRSVTIQEGATVILGLSNLTATDPDHPDDQIRYSITNVVGGTVFLNGTALAAWNPLAPLDPTSTFTAVDLALDRVTFVDDGNNIAPTFSVVAVDPAGAATVEAATITFRSVNDAPRLTVNNLPITEGQPLVLNNTHLLATDEETTDPTRLIYRVRSIRGGRFLTIPVGDITTQFTQADINQGNAIYFEHDGTETRPSFTIEVADANGGTTGVIAANIIYTPINDAPTFTQNVLTIAEGATVTLSTSNILVDDVDTPLSALDFRIDALQNGFFTVNGTVLGVSDTFTRTQLVLGQVSFTASNTGLTPAYTLTVRDNAPANPGTATLAATVTFDPVNDAPEIQVNNFPITEGQDLALTIANLNATDEETIDRSQLIYTVSGVQGGVFFSLTTGAATTSFSQQDVDNNLILFRHSGGETPAAFTLSLSDSTGGTTTAAGNVIYIADNDPPVLSVNNFPISEGGTLRLSNLNLAVTDPDNTPAQLRYTVSAIVAGQFSRDTDLNGTPDQPGITTFTQQDVLDGVIFFIHDGSETVPSFNLVLADTEDTLPVVAANIAFSRVNDPPQSVVLSLNVSTINESGTVTLNGTFTDVDSTVHTVTIDWGNGTTTTLPSSQIVNNGGGNFSLPTINRVYPDDGVFTITATVNDGQATAQGTATLTVNDVLPIVPLSGSGPVEADALYTLTIGNPIDPGADQYTAFRINWGDGSTTTVNSPGNVNKVYKVFGNYTISVTAIDDAGREFGGFTQTANILYPITDFNGDSQTDFLWRNTISGQNSMWFLNGAGNIAATPLVTAVDTSFQIQTVADFNNDGTSDILWRSSTTGLTSIWFMSGTSLIDFEILLTVPDMNWKIIDVVDFNNDGSQDLFWRNQQTGENSFWLLQDGALATFGSIPSVPIEWEVAGLTDFNRDGFDDILWRNTRTGDNVAWVMNGTTFTGQTIDILDAEPSWDIVAVTDINGDKVEDFVWQNRFTPTTSVWFMGPNGVLLGTQLLPDLDPAYELRGATDLNGDNQTDLLWRNPATGDTFAQTMNGGTVTGTIDYLDAPPGWQVFV